MANQLLLLPLDSPLRGQVQNDRWVMAYQFFHLDRTLRDWPIEYDDGKVKITVTGSPIATMYDLEVLIYIVSLMAQRLERGEQVERTFAFSAGDFFRVAGIADSGSEPRSGLSKLRNHTPGLPADAAMDAVVRYLTPRRYGIDRHLRGRPAAPPTSGRH
jgi:hypothetical protein